MPVLIAHSFINLLFLDGIIPISSYEFSVMLKSDEPEMRNYFGLYYYDENKKVLKATGSVRACTDPILFETRRHRLLQVMLT